MGYLTQLQHSALAWLDLSEDEVLVIEGREDIDRFLFDKNGEICQITEIQVKDLTDNVNIRSRPVWESIFNFLLSFAHHRAAGRRCRMQFATTSNLKTQVVANETALRQMAKEMRLELEVDVLVTWAGLDELDVASKAKAVPKLSHAIRALFDKHWRRHLPDAETKKLGQRAQAILLALDGHDADDTWGNFFSAVSWRMGLESTLQAADQLRARIQQHARLPQLPASEFAEILVCHILRVAARGETTARFLTRQTLDELVSRSADSLREWAQQTGLVNLRQWQRRIEDRLDSHDAKWMEFEAVFTKSRPALVEELLRSGSLDEYAPSQLLVPGAELVPFDADIRSTELTLLRSWCESPQRFSLRLLVGPGGTGKTRLALEYSKELRANGWHAGFLDRVPPSLHGDTPLLLVVDYAAGKLDQVRPLIDIAAVAATKVRVLLLARDDGEWWEELGVGSRWPPPHRLEPIPHCRQARYIRESGCRARWERKRGAKP